MYSQSTLIRRAGDEGYEPLAVITPEAEAEDGRPRIELQRILVTGNDRTDEAWQAHPVACRIVIKGQVIDCPDHGLPQQVIPDLRRVGRRAEEEGVAPKNGYPTTWQHAEDASGMLQPVLYPYGDLPSIDPDDLMPESPFQACYELGPTAGGVDRRWP